MKKLVVLLMVVPFSLWVAQATDHKGTHGYSVTVSDEGSSDDCADHLHAYNDDFRSSVRGEETRSVPNQPLTITGEHNGGIQVTTWDQPEFSLKLCKQVAANDESQARSLLADIHLEVGSGEVTVRAPRHDDGDYSLGTVLLVKAPRNATLDLSVHNGGVSLNHFSGTASAHAHNGGISIKNSSGKLTAVAQNGGVSIKDSSGDISVDVQNGGIVLALPERWDGKGLEAHTHNGGLVVAVPRNLQAGVEIVGSSHTSIICKGDACTDAQRTWDNDGRKMLRLGGSNPQIRATTVNGGVVVEQREHSRGEL
jgi:DUF4097 and DUF4098 domain-containing protein YvlB